jgi:uncharacterized protein (TIGR03435 family)
MKMRNFAAPVAMGLLLLPVAWSQGEPAAPARPQFEVASLKPNNRCENAPRAGNLSPSPGRLEMPCVTLQSLLQSAFGTSGDGATINTQRGRTGVDAVRIYSLSAKAGSPARTELMAGPMLQLLFEERFQLKAHRETREMPVYAMTVGNSGLKVQRLAEDACSPIDLTHPPPPPAPGAPPPNPCGIMMLGFTPKGAMKIEVRGANMTQFAQRLSGRVDRTVVDRTAIAGKFNFRLEFTPDPSVRGQASPGGRGGDAGTAAASPVDSTAPADSGPNLFAALQEQIGWKLSPDKGPVGFLIIDQVLKPTAN